MSVEFITNDISGVTQQITQLNNVISDEESNNTNLIDQQNRVKDIIEKEEANLQQKIDKYNSISETGKRDALLKKNGSQRYKQYNKIFFVLTFTVAALIGLELVEKHFPIVPESILTILRIAIISFAIIACFTLNEEINSRDVLNYDKLDLEKPKVDTPEEIEKKRKKAEKEGDLLGSIDSTKVCKGPHNCGDGTQWDSEKMLCVPVLNENFENISPHLPMENYKKL